MGTAVRLTTRRQSLFACSRHLHPPPCSRLFSSFSSSPSWPPPPPSTSASAAGALIPTWASEASEACTATQALATATEALATVTVTVSAMEALACWDSDVVTTKQLQTYISPAEQHRMICMSVHC